MKVKMMVLVFGLCFLLIAAGAPMASAAGNGVSQLEGLKISGLGYLDYSNGVKSNGQSYNAFNLTRGYMTVEKEVTPWLSGRATTDITRDSSGHYEVYEKYLYVQLKPQDLSGLTQMKVEIGQGHTPWIDFAEHINPYRCVTNTFLDSTSLEPSADLGVSIQGYFGGKLANPKEKVGSTSYDGNYGSWHIGVYNGGGYHSAENNNNKAIEGRLTVRPLPDAVPGLQLSYFGVYGKGNVSDPVAPSTDLPDFNINLGMLSYQTPTVILTAQYVQTKGNAGGSWLDAKGKSLTTGGYSFFGNVKLAALDPKLAVFARYDHFDADKDNKMAANDDASYDRAMGGIAYHVYKGNMLVVDYQNVDYKKDSGGVGKAPVIGNDLSNEHKVQAVWQVSF